MPQEKIQNLRSKYNALLQEERKLVAYLEDSAIPFDMRVKKESELCKIANALGGLLLEIEYAGGNYTDDEVLNGFDIV
ncbi:MAG: hypothetical protein ACE5IR_10540 [bacterium]